ncbi:uncharacterized protein ACRADG_005221 [Cochliomyia hominivorax]
MELLTPFLIVGLMQFLTFTSGNPITTISSKESFLAFFDQELFLLAEKFCENAINLSELLLKDLEINEASSDQLKDLKQYLEHLLEDYPHFKRYKLYQPLLAKLMDTINIETINRFHPDYENYVQFKKIFKENLKEILQEFEQNYKKFIQEKFLPKSVALTQQLNEEELQKMPKFQEMVEKLKNCQDYLCFPLYIDPVLKPMNVSQELLVKYSEIDFKKSIALIAIRINNYGPSLLNSKKFQQLSKETQRKLIEDVNDFNSKFQNNSDIDKFIQLFDGKMYYIQKYERNENLPLEDREIWKEILIELKPGPIKDKYDMGTVQVVNNLITKMMNAFRLIPEDDLKPHYQFLGLPFKKQL